MKRQLMGYGATADVFEWQGHTVLKLFKDFIEDQIIEYEALIHEIVYDKGIRMPKLIEEVVVDGRRGYVYERINARTLLFHLTKKQWNVVKYGKLLASTQMDINVIEAPLLPDLKERLREDIHKSKELQIEDVDRLMKYINILPEGNHICHMDFHPGNVFYNGSNTVTIDWITASRSVPGADVARTYLLLKHGGLTYGGPKWLHTLEKIGRHLLTKSYLYHYFKKSTITFEDVEIWLKPIAIARLSENIPLEEKQLLYDTYM